MTTSPALPQRSLIHHHDFRQLWAAETISQIGTQVTQIALPILAVVTLAATEFEMGVLITLETLAFLVIGLPAGAWVDRWRRKRVLVVNDLVRAVALGSIPLAYALDMLTLWQLFAVALVTGVSTVFFDVAYQSFLPSLVDKAQIVEGNSKLEISRAVSQVAGPGAAGLLIKILGAPLMFAFDAISFVASALFIGRIRHEEAVHDRSTRRPLRVEIGEGLSFVLRHPLLRRIVACTGTSNFFSTVTATMLVLFMVRELGFSPAQIGLTFSAGAVGGLLGAATTTRFAKYFGDGRSTVLGAGLMIPFAMLIPLSARGMPMLLLLIAWFGVGYAMVLYNIVQVSFRQRLCPIPLLGRMNASTRFLVWGTMPLGGLVGGTLGSWLGVLPTLWIGALGSILAFLPVFLSPLRTMRDLPTEYDAHAGGNDADAGGNDGADPQPEIDPHQPGLICPEATNTAGPPSTVVSGVTDTRT
ncbi:MAG: MFS transporter [Geodermatophilaceae bacterium]|nr:MFS transporter [Geodermatophilaceae bacterium]